MQSSALFDLSTSSIGPQHSVVLDVDTFIIKLEHERKLSLQLDLQIRLLHSQVTSKRRVLLQLSKNRLKEKISLLENELGRTNTQLSQMAVNNSVLREQVDISRKELTDYQTKAQEHKTAFLNVSSSAEFVRSDSVRRLHNVQGLKSRMWSLRNLHETRSHSSQAYLLNLESQIRADKKRNRDVLKNLEKGMKGKHHDYTESAACISNLQKKWADMIKAKRREMQQHQELVRNLESGFFALNDDGTGATFQQIASVAISAFARNQNLTWQLLTLTEETETLEASLTATRRVLACKVESESDSDAAFNRMKSDLTQSCLAVEKAKGLDSVQLQMLKDAIQDLFPVLREYEEILTCEGFRSDYKRTDLQGTVGFETVFSFLHGLEDATMQLGTLLLLIQKKKQPPWPESRRTVSVSPSLFLSSWEPEDFPIPRTKAQFRANATKIVAKSLFP